MVVLVTRGCVNCCAYVFACSIILLFQVVTFFNNPRLRNIVVIDAAWLLTEIVGIIFSPENFPPPRITFKDGIIDRRDFIKEMTAIPKRRRRVEADMICDMVLNIGLLLQDGTKIIAPGLLKSPDNVLGTWKAIEDDSIISGVEVSCVEPTFFAAGAVVRVQSRLHSYYTSEHGCSPILAKNLINVTPSSSLAEGCVLFSASMIRCWIISRAPAQNAYDVFYLLQFLREVVREEVAASSPGTRTTTNVLSSASARKQLTTAENVLDAHPFNETAAKAGNEQIRTARHLHVDRVSDLLHVQDGHFRVMSLAGRGAVEAALVDIPVGDLVRDLNLSVATPVSTCLQALDEWALAGYGQTCVRLRQTLQNCRSSKSYVKLFKVLAAEKEWVSNNGVMV